MKKVTLQEAKETFNELYIGDAPEWFILREIFDISKEEAIKALEEKTIFKIIKDLTQ